MIYSGAYSRAAHNIRHLLECIVNAALERLSHTAPLSTHPNLLPRASTLPKVPYMDIFYQPL